MSNIIDEKLFEKIFDHTLETLASKPINTTSKEENQIIVDNIEKNIEKLYEKDKTRWILLVWSVKKILKILIQKCLEQKNNRFHYYDYGEYYDEYYDNFHDYCDA